MTTTTGHWKAPDPASYTVVDGDEWEDLQLFHPDPIAAAELLVLSAQRIGTLTAQLARYTTPDPTVVECAAAALYHQDGDDWAAQDIPEWVRENYRRDARAMLEAVAQCQS